VQRGGGGKEKEDFTIGDLKRRGGIRGRKGGRPKFENLKSEGK